MHRPRHESESKPMLSAVWLRRLSSTIDHCMAKDVITRQKATAPKPCLGCKKPQTCRLCGKQKARERQARFGKGPHEAKTDHGQQGQSSLAVPQFGSSCSSSTGACSFFCPQPSTPQI